MRFDCFQIFSKENWVRDAYCTVSKTTRCNGSHSVLQIYLPDAVRFYSCLKIRADCKVAREFLALTTLHITCMCVFVYVLYVRLRIFSPQALISCFIITCYSRHVWTARLLLFSSQNPSHSFIPCLILFERIIQLWSECVRQCFSINRPCKNFQDRDILLWDRT